MNGANGEHIELQWEDYPQFYVIRGHVTFQEAKDTLMRSLGSLDGLSEPIHGHCRWQFNGQDEWGNRRRELWESGPGRGAFKCTIFRTKWHHEIMNAKLHQAASSSI